MTSEPESAISALINDPTSAQTFISECNIVKDLYCAKCRVLMLLKVSSAESLKARFADGIYLSCPNCRAKK